MATLEQRIMALEERAGMDAGSELDLSALTQEERGLWAVLVKRAEGFTPRGIRLLDHREFEAAKHLLQKILHHGKGRAPDEGEE